MRSDKITASSWEALSLSAFAPFGDVIEAGAGRSFAINDGTTIRHEGLADIDVGAGGCPVVSIFESRPFGFPLTVRVMERHPLSSQAFIPMQPKPYFVVVAPPGDRVDASSIRVFLARGDQGVNYRSGVWHHAAVVIEPMAFLVLDRGTQEPNCDFFHLPDDATGPVLDWPGDAPAVG